MPVNNQLLTLLQSVENATDPWLLFLCVSIVHIPDTSSRALMLSSCSRLDRKALFLRRLSRREEAIESALRSIAAYPWNWSTWTILGECLGDGEEVSGGVEAAYLMLELIALQLSSIMPLIPLPSTHPLVQMFHIKILNSLNSPSENELTLCDRLLQEDMFPRSLWIMSLRACVLYHLHGMCSNGVFNGCVADLPLMI